MKVQGERAIERNLKYLEEKSILKDLRETVFDILKIKNVHLSKIVNKET